MNKGNSNKLKALLSCTVIGLTIVGKSGQYSVIFGYNVWQNELYIWTTDELRSYKWKGQEGTVYYLQYIVTLHLYRTYILRRRHFQQVFWIHLKHLP